MYIFCKEVIGETLDSHIAKFFDSYVATEWLSKQLLILSSFMAPIATFVRRKTRINLSNENKVFAKSSKMEPVAATEACSNIIEEPPSQSDSEFEACHRARYSGR